MSLCEAIGYGAPALARAKSARRNAERRGNRIGADCPGQFCVSVCGERRRAGGRSADGYVDNFCQRGQRIEVLSRVSAGAISAVFGLVNLVMMKKTKNIGLKVLIFVGFFAATLVVCWLLALAFLKGAGAI